MKVHVEYGENDLKEILLNLLKQEYINIINKKYSSFNKENTWLEQ